MNNLLHSIENYHGTVIVITNLETLIDDNLIRRFKFVVKFKEPDASLRSSLWQKLLPVKVPLDKDVNLSKLAHDYDMFTGGNIENIIFRACSRAALTTNKTLNQKLLVTACDEELENAGKLHKTQAKNMYQ